MSKGTETPNPPQPQQMERQQTHAETESFRPSPFTTTSDLMKKLNDVMERYHQADLRDNDKNDGATNTPAFELQRRLPDGSSRPAFNDEVKAVDLETKVRQVAQHVASLKSDEEKRAFGDAHRQYGNQLYANGQYQEAIDVYLTCLTVIPTEARETNLAFLQLLNNLAQAALQLHWYRKVQEFCRLALEEVNAGKLDQTTTAKVCSTTAASDDTMERQFQISKLYFKRGKASRHRGEYVNAQNDLTQALTVLSCLSEMVAAMPVKRTDGDEDNGNKTDKIGVASRQTKWMDTVNASKRAVQKELQAVHRGAQEGRKNRERHRQAMQKVLGCDSSDNTKKASKSVDVTTYNASNENGQTEAKRNTPLYESSSSSGRQRSFSTLRAPASCRMAEAEDEIEISVLQSYYYYYLSVFGHVAQKLLEWIGDGELDDSPQQGKEKMA